MRTIGESETKDGMSRDINQRLASIADRFEATSEPITSPVLAEVAELFRCQWATLWLVDAERAMLFPDLVWNLEPSRVWHLEENTRVRTLSLSEGTAGHVWRSRKPIWTTDLIRDMCLPRSLDARDAGLRGGIWFAIQTDTVVYGVIELLGIDSLPASADGLLAIEEFGRSLGLLVERQSALQ